jgi:hypothetical protein
LRHSFRHSIKLVGHRLSPTVRPPPVSAD